MCRKLILKCVDDESDLHHAYVMVDYNILNLCFCSTITLCIFVSICCGLIGFRGFWLNTILYDDIPNVVVICEFKDKGNIFTSADHSVYRVSFPLKIHLRHSSNERFIPSTNPFVQGA